MKLADWIKRQKMKRKEFARLVGLSPSYVTELCYGDWPSKDVAKRIKEATKGKVTPNDFLTDAA